MFSQRQRVARCESADSLLITLGQKDLLSHARLSDLMPRVGVVVMAVEAFDQDGLSVDQKQAILDLTPGKADFSGEVIDCRARREKEAWNRMGGRWKCGTAHGGDNRRLKLQTNLRQI